MSAFFFCVFLGIAGFNSPVDESHSYSAGRTLCAEQDAMLLVLVHGSDWHPFSERLFQEVWTQEAFIGQLGAGFVLSDVDILQTTDKTKRGPNTERNKGWEKKGSGLRTYPAVLAYTQTGTLIGSRQGRQLPKDLAGAQKTLAAFSVTCLRWRELTNAMDHARESGEGAKELALLIEREALDLDPSATLLADIKRLDPTDTSGHHARLSFPKWTTLVQQATAEAKGGKGAEAEQRLKAMLGNPAYTPDQRAVIQLALGSSYRRWEGHDTQAAACFQAAFAEAPDSVSGQAGRRLYLSSYAGPSLEFGWTKRHLVAKNTTWIIEDLPTDLEAGNYTLRLKLTKGKALRIASARLMIGEDIRVHIAQTSTLNKGQRECVLEFNLPEALADATLHLLLDGGAAGTGTIAWARVD